MRFVNSFNIQTIYIQNSSQLIGDQQLYTLHLSRLPEIKQQYWLVHI